MRYLPFVLLCILISISCKKDKIEKPVIDCGCNSKTERVIQNFPAVYNGMGGLLIFEQLEGNITSIMASEICNIDTSLTASINMKVPDYLVSGKLKTKCIAPIGVWTGPESFEITEIRKIKKSRLGYMLGFKTRRQLFMILEM